MTSEQKRAEFGKLSGNFQNGIPGIEKKKNGAIKYRYFTFQELQLLHTFMRNIGWGKGNAARSLFNEE